LSEEEIETMQRQVGHDGFWVLERLAATGSPALQTLPEVTTLRTVWAQHYRPKAGKITLEDPTVDAKELIVTPHDPEVRVGKKRGTSWHGEKVHVTETAEEGEMHFLTDVTTASASSGDVEALPTIRAQLAARDLLPSEQDVDAGYISGQQLLESSQAGILLLGPPLLDTSPQEFKIAHFQLDRATQTAICPAGQRAVKWSARTERDGSAAVNIQFAAADCAVCPLRVRCTTARVGGVSI
jgi:transposase